MNAERWNDVLESLSSGLGLMVFRLAAVVLIGSALLRWSHARARRIIRLEVSAGRVRREFLAALGLVLVDSLVFTVVHHLGPIRFGTNELPSVALSFVGIFVWFELEYFVLHRLLHTRALYGLHRRHHEATVTHPLTGFVFSGAERLLQTAVGFGGVALASRLMPISPVALEAYLVLSYLLNGLAHANVELFPEGWARSAPGQVFISATFHALHHARFKGHYGLYTTVLDRLCGTVFADAVAVHDAAARGEGLPQLGTRLSPG